MQPYKTYREIYFPAIKNAEFQLILGFESFQQCLEGFELIERTYPTEENSTWKMTKADLKTASGLEYMDPPEHPDDLVVVFSNGPHLLYSTQIETSNWYFIFAELSGLYQLDLPPQYVILARADTVGIVGEDYKLVHPSPLDTMGVHLFQLLQATYVRAGGRGLHSSYAMRIKMKKTRGKYLLPLSAFSTGWGVYPKSDLDLSCLSRLAEIGGYSAEVSPESMLVCLTPSLTYYYESNLPKMILPKRPYLHAIGQ